MDLPSSLKDAITKLEELTRMSATPRVVGLTGYDGKAMVEVELPISVNSEGTIELHTAEYRMLSSILKEQRLAGAPGPDRRTGIASLTTAVSFAAHVERFKTPESVVYANPVDCTLVALYDYHPAGEDMSKAGWQKHRAVYRAHLSTGWGQWGGVGERVLAQEEFCQLLDSRDWELTAEQTTPGKEWPKPAALLSMIGELETFSTKTCKRERQKGNAMRLISTEESGVKSVELPRSFGVKVPVFEGQEPEVHEVRLSLQVKDGEPTFILTLHRAKEKMLEAFAALTEELGEQTGVPTFIGEPEA